jgi:hypothetical protein
MNQALQSSSGSPLDELSHVERIRIVAESFNALTVGVLVLFAMHCLIVFGPFALIGFLIALFLVFKSLGRTFVVFGLSKSSRAVLYVLLFVPVINLIVLATFIFKSTNLLQSAGVRVGPFGVDKHELDRFCNERQ